MTGKLNVRSTLFDANEWMPERTDATAIPQPRPTDSEEEETTSTEVFDRFDFTLDA